MSDEFDTAVNAIGYRKAIMFFAVRIAAVSVALALILWWMP